MQICRRRSLVQFVLLTSGLVFSLLKTASGVTSESPEVKEMIARAVEFLGPAKEDRFGGDCLVGLALHKAKQPPSHPRIVAAVQNCRSRVSKNPEDFRESIYATGLAIIFLCELEPKEHEDEIKFLVDSLLIRQKSMGAWGYPPGNSDFKTGDTSMTQYAVLSAWTAQRSGVLDFPVDSIAQVCNWLLRTQDPTGAWGYQGVDPGEGVYERVEQSDVRHSLAVAGLGSLYVCADLLGFSEPVELEEVDPSLPKALKAVKANRSALSTASPRTDAVDGNILRRRIYDGDRWFVGNYRIDPENWTHYFMYGYERYQSFRELAQGKLPREARWYNDGVEFLKKTQHPNGSWTSRSSSSVDTSFALLFLLRSTQQSIKKATGELGEGVLTGGRGLPTDVTDVKLENGKIVRSPLRTSADALFALLEDTSDVEVGEVPVPTDIILSDEPVARSEQLQRLRRLTTHKDYSIRATSVKALATTRDFENVPALIYALTDPDARIVVQARDGLRFISRKFIGFGLPDRPNGQEKTQG